MIYKQNLLIDVILINLKINKNRDYMIFYANNKFK